MFTNPILDSALQLGTVSLSTRHGKYGVMIQPLPSTLLMDVFPTNTTCPRPRASLILGGREKTRSTAIYLYGTDGMALRRLGMTQ